MAPSPAGAEAPDAGAPGATLGTVGGGAVPPPGAVGAPDAGGEPVPPLGAAGVVGAADAVLGGVDGGGEGGA